MSSSITNFYQLVVIVLSELQTLSNSQVFVLRAEPKCSKYSGAHAQYGFFVHLLYGLRETNLDINGHLFSLLIPSNIVKECGN